MIKLYFQIGHKYKNADEIGDDIRQMIKHKFEMIVGQTEHQHLYCQIQGFSDYFERGFHQFKYLKLVPEEPLNSQQASEKVTALLQAKVAHQNINQESELTAEQQLTIIQNIKKLSLAQRKTLICILSEYHPSLVGENNKVVEFDL